MTRIRDLLDDSTPALSALAERPAGLFVDFDGTISRLAPRTSGTRSASATSCTPATTGRRASRGTRTRGLPWQSSTGGTIERVLRDLRGLADVDGMIWEHKGSSAAVHYRATADPESARRGLAAALDSVGATGLQTFWGKMILEIRPPVGLHKGHAIRSVVEERGLSGAVFLGDDSTDVDGMQALTELRRHGKVRGCGVAVVDKGTPAALLEAADYRLDGVDGVETLLERLCESL